MKTLITTLVVIAAIFVGIGLVRGWFTYSQTEDKATIEVETGEIKKDAVKVKEAGEELLDETGKALEDSGVDSSEPATEPADNPRNAEDNKAGATPPATPAPQSSQAP